MWTKPEEVGLRVGGRDGWGRGVWWGENGDNYTWTKRKKERGLKMVYKDIWTIRKHDKLKTEV